MKRFLSIFVFVIAAQSAHAVEFVCQSNSQLKLTLSGVQASPATVSNISLEDKQVPQDSLITSVGETADSIAVEFVNLATASAFEFEIGKEALQLPSFTLDVFELGSPGSPSQSHVFSCVTQ